MYAEIHGVREQSLGLAGQARFDEADGAAATLTQQIGAVTREFTGLEIPRGRALGASWGLDRYAVNDPYKLQHSKGLRATVASSCQRLAYWDVPRPST